MLCPYCGTECVEEEEFFPAAHTISVEMVCEKCNIKWEGYLWKSFYPAESPDEKDDEVPEGQSVDDDIRRQLTRELTEEK
jgi:hypothetical protein